MIKLLSGNEALAWGAYHSGVKVAAAYPGTPSTEILEAISHFDDIYAEWSTNEKVAMEVVMGAVYAGVRSLASMKQVGFNEIWIAPESGSQREAGPITLFIAVVVQPRMRISNW